MPIPLLIFLLLAVCIRLGSVAVSGRNERVLAREGATEHGAGNSAVLALVHLAYYVAAPAEGWLRGWPVDAATWAGMLLYAFGIAWLVVVIVLLGRLWTVKLILSPSHVLVTHPVFRVVRHPNYFLGIVPELVGYAVAFHAWATLAAGLATYAVPLVRRIRQEEAMMRHRFADYA